MSLADLAPASPPAVPVAAPTTWTVPTVQAAHLAAPAHDPLPLPPPGWGAAQALLALDEARLALDGPLPRATVVSALTTVVLRAGGHAVKVYPPGTDAAHLGRVATALAGSASALVGSPTPVVTSWGVVTLSGWVPPAAPVGWAQTAALLRAFHAEHADADVPAWDPLRRLVAESRHLPDDAASVLLAARDLLLAEVARLDPPLGVGVVHGDVSPANVLAGRDGPRLIDLDFVARAPREYDLSSAARRADAGELDAPTYLAFCRAYGADVRAWDGRAVLDAVAALGGVAFRLWDDRHHGRASGAWLGAALTRWRTPL